jgi:hypothetical protein
MREQQFFHSQRPVAAQPPPLNPNRTRIEINWWEVVAKTIEIRRHHNEMAAKVCCINPAGAGPDCRQGHDAQFALTAKAQKIFTSRPGRRAA